MVFAFPSRDRQDCYRDTFAPHCQKLIVTREVQLSRSRYEEITELDLHRQ